MSSRQLFACKYCGRKNFRSKSGLQRHIDTKLTCRDQYRVGLEQMAAIVDDAAEIVHETELNNNILFPAMASAVHNELAAELANDEMDDLVNDDIIMQNDDIIMEQDDDDWGVDSDSDQDEDDGNPARQALLDFRAQVRKVKKDFQPFDKDEVMAIKLMTMLRKKRATLDTYDEVMKWHHGISENDDPGGYLSRQVMLKRLGQRYGFGKQFVEKRKLTLPSTGAKVTICLHDVKKQVVSQLTDPRFGDDDWLHFGDNPFAPPPPDLDYLGDINTGSSFRETFKELIIDKGKLGKAILVPVELYLDAAVTGQFDKNPVEAMQMCLGLLKHEARIRHEAWRTLGYVPNYTPSESRGKKILEESQHAAAHLMPVEEEEGNSEQEVSDGEDAPKILPYNDDKEYGLRNIKAQDLHAILAVILEGFRQLQEEGMIWDYKYQGKIYKNVELVFYVAFVKCDTDEADKLCGHYKSRGRNVKNICRYCVVPTDETDNPFANYAPKTVHMISKLVERNDALGDIKLKQISQHNIVNAFHPLRFGSHNNCGIHGACPMEMLHHILLGIYKYLRDSFLLQMGESSKSALEINALAKLLGKFFAHQSDRDLPKTNFAKGIFEGKIMGKEFSGVMLLIAAILQTAKGKDVLKKARGRNFREDWLIEDWSLLVETVLEWEAFLKLDRMPMKTVERLKKKHRFVMFLIKKIANRTTGMGMKTMKFHGILHLYQDMVAFGVAMLFDTGANESHHKLTKVCAKLTQKDITVFEFQTALRVVEQHLLDLAMCEIQGKPVYEYFALDQRRGPINIKQKAEDDDQVPWTGGTQLEVFFDEDDHEAAFRFPMNKELNGRWEQSILTFLNDLQQYAKDKHGISGLDIRTEHKRAGNLFRGHPDFRQKGQWNDWAMFDWGRDGVLPGEIWCFVDFTKQSERFGLQFAGCIVRKGVYAVIESTTWCPNVDIHGNTLNVSTIFTPIIKEAGKWNADQEERRFYLADVEAIVAPVCVIPDIGSQNKLRYFTVKQRKDWAEQFIKWLHEPHYHDEAEMSNYEEED